MSEPAGCGGTFWRAHAPYLRFVPVPSRRDLTKPPTARMGTNPRSSAPLAESLTPASSSRGSLWIYSSRIPGGASADSIIRFASISPFSVNDSQHTSSV